jgi:5-amino-6-(5-phosphoribosylamino)uracil reductase
MTTNHGLKRPQTTLVLAISADGKISDVARSPADFGSPNDKAHLENQVAQADGIVFGAGTLRAGGTAMRVSNPELLQQRESLGKPQQPVQIVCSKSGDIDPQFKFFRQPIPRWLLTTSVGAKRWQEGSEFERVLVFETSEGKIDWILAFQEMAQLGLKHLGILGGGSLVASLLEVDLIDEFWLTVCPLIFGGATAPTPVEGAGFSPEMAPRLELLSVKTIDQEVFLHYRLQR